MLKLFESIKIGNLELKNRVVMSPMCMNEAINEDGLLTDFHKVHYGARALGGIAMTIFEATAIDPNGKINPKDLGLWNEKQRDAFKELTSLLHQFGAKVGVQISHAGRKAKKTDRMIAPSPIQFTSDYQVPNEMTEADIEKIIQQFKQTAIYAKEAGVDMIEIHAAHGYLLNQFLSPLSNHRIDQYGGSLENRYRIVKEVIKAVKEVYSGALWIRLSAKEYDEQGSTMDDMIQIAKWAKQDGVELVDVSTGGVISRAPDKIFAGYQVSSAHAIKTGAEVPVGAVGLLNDPKLAEYVLQSEQADLILLGRPLLSNPNWLQMAAVTLEDYDAFKPYNHSYERGRKI